MPIKATAGEDSRGYYFMEKVAIDQLRVRDSHDQPITLAGYTSERLLLIFHRHLA